MSKRHLVRETLTEFENAAIMSPMLSSSSSSGARSGTHWRRSLSKHLCHQTTSKNLNPYFVHLLPSYKDYQEMLFVVCPYRVCLLLFQLKIRIPSLYKPTLYKGQKAVFRRKVKDFQIPNTFEAQSLFVISFRGHMVFRFRHTNVHVFRVAKATDSTNSLSDYFGTLAEYCCQQYMAPLMVQLFIPLYTFCW